MTRFAPLAILIALTATAHAQSQAELAAKANDEGKQLMYEDKYAEAAKKFQEAVARVPEAKYFVNLCTARLQEGQLGEALTACNAVELNNPTPEQKDRAQKLIGKINDEAKTQGLDLKAAGGGTSGSTSGSTGSTTGTQLSNSGTTGSTGSTSSTGSTTTGATTTTVSDQQPQGTIGRPLTESLVAAGPPDNRYTWTLGIDLFGGGGQIGQPNAYGSAVGGFRVKADYLINPAMRFGGQLYLQYSHLGQGKNDIPEAQTLDIVDFGVAAYKDFCPGGTPRLCFTPLLGAHVALMSPAGETDNTGSQLFNYAALGARAELSMAVAFGRRYEHVFSIQAGANIYTPVISDSGDFSAMDVGLDTFGVAGYFGLGYTYRFNTPLGRAPFIILE